MKRAPTRGEAAHAAAPTQPPSRRERQRALRERIQAAARANPDLRVDELMERFRCSRSLVNDALSQRVRR